VVQACVANERNASTSWPVAFNFFNENSLACTKLIGMFSDSYTKIITFPFPLYTLCDKYEVIVIYLLAFHSISVR
jgi:hypothetical protein